jgi:OOP family OmpA-OmpF porin
MKLMKTLIVVSLTAAGLAVSSLAMAQMQDRGWYVGGSLGKTEDKESCPTTSCDLKDTGWKIFGGMRLNRNFAVEGAYMDLGSFKATGTLSGVPVNVNVDVTSWSVSGVGLLPLAEDRFTLFGKAGLSYTTAKGSGSAGSFSTTGTEHETELLWGLGAMYNFTRSLGVRAEWERLQKSDVNMMSLGVQYRF